MPPESLFSHFLRCSSVPLELDISSYRKTFQPSSDQQHQEEFIRGNDNEICFSLDDYIGDFGSNFFYKDCPAAVSLSDKDKKKTFTLPGIMSVECANIVGVGLGELKCRNNECFRMVPSNLWSIRREVEGWTDYPVSYSFNVSCGILGSNMVQGCDLSGWIVANSPRYGIVIDGYVADHILVLVKLCLKAILREALGVLDTDKVCRDVQEKDLKGKWENRIFSCPVLVQVLMWLAMQLSTLYGETGGKLFAIGILKQCLLKGASRLSLLPLEERVAESSDSGEQSHVLHSSSKEIKLEEELKSGAECKVVTTEGETLGSGMIFVSQVAAAVAALHKRRILEEKIRQLQANQQLNRYQRFAEHAYLSERANEERKKRTDYRPIIDHDGLPRQPLTDQETNKAKTREEILAEERDYKRRRMSYRGKKAKRAPLEVMRDIIEEYTEEIKKAGGIGLFVKGAEEGETAPSPTDHNLSVDFEDLSKSVNDEPESARGTLDHFRKRSHSCHGHNTRSSTSEVVSERYREISRQEKHESHDQRHIDTKRRNEGYSRSSKRPDSHVDKISHRTERDNAESSRSKYYENRRASSSRMSRHSGQRSSYSMSSRSDEESRGFNDRYDPSESHDRIDEDHDFTGSKRVRRE